MQDAEDQGMESTRDDNEREQGLGLEAGEDGYQDLFDQFTPKNIAACRPTSFGRSCKPHAPTSIATDERRRAHWDWQEHRELYQRRYSDGLHRAAAIMRQVSPTRDSEASAQRCNSS
jgi:hypothetical protein